MRRLLQGLLASVTLLACGGPAFKHGSDVDGRKEAAEQPEEVAIGNPDRPGPGATPGTPGAPTAPPAKPPTAFGNGAGFTAITPVRLLDSRDGTGLGAAGFVGQLEGNVERSIDLRGLDAQLGASATRAGLALNVTVTAPAADGFLRVYACGTSPDGATLTFTAGETVAAMALVAAGDSVCVLSNAPTSIVIDALGAFEKGRGARFTPIAARRVFDSRTAARATTFKLPVTDLAAGTVGVAAHLTVTEPTGPGFARIHPCGTETATSSINFAAGETIGTTILTPVDAEKNLCVTANVDVHVVVDIEATFGGGLDGFVPTGPARVFDSRNSGGDGATTFELALPNLPRNTTTAVLNLTAIGAPVEAYVVAHACGAATSTANLNVAPGKVRTTALFVPVSADGRVCIDASAPLHVIADVVGTLAP